MSQKTITKTAHIKRRHGESIIVDGTRVTVFRIKGETWLEVEIREGVIINRAPEKVADSALQTVRQ